MNEAAARGLSAGELAAAAAELRALCGATVLDAAPLRTAHGGDDLLLVLRDEHGVKHFVHVACGGTRARVATTARRFAKHERRSGAAADVLNKVLEAATLRDVTAAAGERRCSFAFASATGELLLHVELFGARGLWVLCDATGTVLAASRAVETAVRTLRVGDLYAPPPPLAAREEPPSRFRAPVLPAIDEHFAALDAAAERLTAEQDLRRAVERALHKARTKEQGLRHKLDDARRAIELRSNADLMLAYAHTVRRGETRMQVVDVDGATRTLPLDPATPVTVQANQLYDKARRLDAGRELAERRHGEAAALVAELTELAARLDAPGAHGTDGTAAADAVRVRLEQLGVLPRPAAASPRSAAPKRPDVPFRRFESAEGYPIWVGRNNAQNDELTMRFANGNDVWLHVGGGRAGSHVVVRPPKQKTASLETLLDAATLAVHFSKARGERRVDVIYTLRKNVKKPKGLPPGAVVPARTKTITVLADEARLRRLLERAGDAQD